MIKSFALICFCLSLQSPVRGENSQFTPQFDTWANWDRRLDDAFGEFSPRKIPGRTLGILVPNDARQDILALTAYGYESLLPSKAATLIIVLPAPEGYPVNGIVMPQTDFLFTSFQVFVKVPPIPQ